MISNLHEKLEKENGRQVLRKLLYTQKNAKNIRKLESEQQRKQN